RHQVFSTELSYMAPVLLQRLQKEFPSLARHINKISFVNSERFFREKEEKDIREKRQKKSLHPFSPEYKMIKNRAEKLFEFENDEEADSELQEIFLKLFLDKY